MDLNTFRELGERIGEAYRRVNCDEVQLSQIAGHALREAELPPVDFSAIANFLCLTDIEQDPGNNFSDLPLVVYRSPDFYIQLLVWNESTTSIHEHAFTGAFRVLEGSSIHSRYGFEERERISSRMLIGDVNLEEVELLRKGDVREIQPGQGGLLHALYHLDHPSATVVVRTPRLPWAMPQYSVIRPCFAVDEPALRGDGQVRILRRALHATRAADPSSVPDVLQAMVRTVDFPRLFMLHGELDTILPDEDDQAALFEAMETRYGTLAGLFREALTLTRVQQSLLKARGFTTDPELRFLFALLLNVPDRDWLLRIVEERFPGDQPASRCAQWIDRLTGADAMLDALVRKGAMQKAKKRPQGLVERLTALLPKSADERKGLLGSLLGDGDAADTDAANKLREVPELAPLFR